MNLWMPFLAQFGLVALVVAWAWPLVADLIERERKWEERERRRRHNEAQDAELREFLAEIEQIRAAILRKYPPGPPRDRFLEAVAKIEAGAIKAHQETRL